MLVWTANTETRGRLCAAGIRFLRIDYAGLQAAPDDTMRQIFAFAGVPPTPREGVLAALGRDSHEGSPLARREVERANRTVPDSDRATAAALLRSRGHADVV